jgi:hypothetical protein
MSPKKNLMSAILVVLFLLFLSTGQVVAKTNTTTTLTSSLNPSTYQTSVTFTATLSPTAATGTVTFKDGTTTLGTGTLSSGKATLSVTTLTAGSHSITASYGGDSNYNTSTSSALTQTVNKANTTTTLTSSLNPSNYQTSVTFTATLSPSAATGTVTFKDGATTLGTGNLVSGKTTLSVTSLTAGTHTITASYPGDSNDNSSISGNLTQTVNKANTTTTLTSSLNPSTYQASVTFTATVSPAAATGMVTFKDGSTTLGTGTLVSGKTTLSVTTLTAGTHTITASYPGDSNDNSSISGNLTQTVNKANTTTTLTSSLNPSTYQASVTFTATVSPAAATGTVTFKDGSATLGTGTLVSGKTTFSTTALTVATHTITASYPGDSNDNSSISGNLSQTVNKASTTTTLTSSPNPSIYQTSVTFTATVSPAAATGTVTFKDGSTTLGTGSLVSGKTTYSTTALALGSHSITATYGGDSNDNSSTSSPVTQLVKANTTTTLTSSPNPSTYQTSVTFTATISPTAATGTVTFYDGATQLGTGQLSGGKTTYSTAALTVGSHTITASYGGDTNYNSSTSPNLTQTVNKANTTTALTSSPNPSTYPASVIFTATVSPAAATGTVTFYDGATQLGTGQLSGGKTTYSTAALTVGSHTITASYAGDSNYNISTSPNLTQTVKAGPPTIASLTPNFGPTGSLITITGTNFGSSQGSSTVKFYNGVTATPCGTCWSSTSITVAVPSAATTGNVVVTVSGVASNGSPFTVLPTPSITGLSSASGGVGVSIVIGGTNFGANQGSSTVTFNGTAAAVCGTCWSNTLITTTVPSGATSGNLVVTVNGVQSSPVSFTVPVLTSIALPFASLPVAPGGTQQLAATAIYSDYSSQDITSVATWTSSNPSVATINSAGLFTGVAYGQTAVQASFGGISSQAVTMAVEAVNFIATGNLNTGRTLHSATVLNDGTVLVAGGTNSVPLSSAELYGPTAGTFTITSGSMTVPRSQHTATLLSNGTVLIVAGESITGTSAELYNPASGTFAATGSMNIVRNYGHTATLLQNGQVLIVGGTSSGAATAELYNPATGQFTTTGSMSAALHYHTATLLNNGQVLITGGADVNNSVYNSAELYDPVSGQFTSTTGSMSTGRIYHTATLLANGQVLVAGGEANIPAYGSLGSAEIYDPSSGTFTLTGNLTAMRAQHSATLLSDGVVLLAGGDSSPTPSAELFYPGAGTFGPTGPMVTVPPYNHTASLLTNGTVLIAGGSYGFVYSELYQPTSFTTPPSLISLSVSPLSYSIVVGTNYPFTATGVFADGSSEDMTNTVSWGSSVPSVATISSAGSATGGFPGTTTITATSGSVSASTTLSVIAVQLKSISITANPGIVLLGSSEQLSAIGTYNDGSWKDLTSSVTWSSAAPSIATISATGLATGVSVGTALIQATLGSVQSGVYFSVAAPLQSLSISPGSEQLSIGSIVQLQAIGTFSNGNSTVTSLSVWSSSDTNVATVSNGLVTSLASGTATITATYGWFGTNLSTSILVTVTNQYAPPQISAATYPTQALTGAWTNVNTTVTFTCTPGGLPIVSCTSPQTVTTEGTDQVVTGTVTDSAGTSVSTSVTLNIDKTPPALTISSLADGSTFTSTPITVTGAASDSLSGLASVTCNGAPASTSGGTFSCNVGLNVGANAVRVVASDYAGNASAIIFHETLTGTLPPPNSLQVTPATLNILAGNTQQFTATDQNGQPRTDATWTLSDTSLASITAGSSPTLTAISAGQVTLTATVGSVSAQTQITISALTVFSPGTEVWTVPSASGFSAQQIVSAVPVNTVPGPDLYSIQSSSDGTQAVVQALTIDGQQMWQTGPYEFSTLIGPAAPDGFGGLLVTEACNSNNPAMTTTDLDAVTGTPLWQFQLPSLLPDGAVACPQGPNFAIRQDGSVVIAAPLAMSPRIVILDGQSGALVANPQIPASTLTSDMNSVSCDCYTPVGPPMVNSDGSTYVEYYVRQLNSDSPDPVSGVLWLLKIAPDGSTSTTRLSSSNVANLWPGQIIPDGQGGVLATWAIDPANPPAAPYPYQAADVVGGIVASSFNMPMSPQNLTRDPNTGIPLPLQLVLGESSAFVSYGSNIVSFAANSGSVNWNYQAASQTTVTLVVSTAGGGLVAKSTYQNVDTMLQLDGSGNATPYTWSAPNTTYWAGSFYPASSSAVTTEYSDAEVPLSGSPWQTLNESGTGKATGNFSVQGFSTTGANEDVITADLQIIQAQLPSDPVCSSWLGNNPTGTTGLSWVQTLLANPNYYGYGTVYVGGKPYYKNGAFTGAYNADNTLVSGLPTSPTPPIFTVNAIGGFFNVTDNKGGAFTLGPNKYPGNTLRNQLATIIHEFGHQLEVYTFVGLKGEKVKFQDDQGNPAAGDSNDAYVNLHCRALIERPWINSLSPTSGSAGTKVNISGGNFLASQGTSVVTFYNGVVAPGYAIVAHVNNWSETQITVTVPNGIQPGLVFVVVTVGGEMSNTATFAD